MKYSCKSTFGATLLKALETTALGTLVSIRDNNGTDILTINIGPLEIPQYPVNPVRRIECVEIIAVDNELPVVFCREDFPIVPHLNVLENGKKTLCLFDVSFEDVKYMFNANMFLRRIVYWFEETARGQLHQPDQPLEPYFPGAKDIIVLPLHSDGNPFIRLRKVQMPHGVLYQAVPVENVSDGQIYTVLPIEIKKTLSENIINKMPQTLGELDDAFNESIIDSLEQYIPQIWSVKQTALYKKLFQQKEKELRHSAVIIILWISLARTCDADPEGLTIKAFQLSENFQTLYQTFGYRKDTKGKLLKLQSEDKHSNLPLIPYEVMFSFDRASAHLYSGYSVSETEGNYVQIGLGALGSQIANNCIRAGYGKWTYVDSDTVFPHNLARHCLDQAYIGQNKAQAMLDYANTLTGTYDSSVLKAISHDVLNINAKDTLVSAINSADLIVDCSASVAVERYLSFELAGQTRTVCFFMNPSGTALIMLLENADRSICLDSLEMQYYRLLIREPLLEKHLKSDRRVLYSSTCRGTSLIYPQDNAAIFAGLCSKAIKTVKNNIGATVSIWTLDKLSLQHFEVGDELFDIVNKNGWNIKISPTLIEKLYTQRHASLPNETGGVLIGSYDFAHNICYIVDSIDSPSDSEEYPNAYIRGCKGLGDNISRIENITIGNLTYVGEWHSHPTVSTQPSKDDLFLLSSIKNYTSSHGNPGCMLIVGKGNYSLYFELS